MKYLCTWEVLSFRSWKAPGFQGAESNAARSAVIGVRRIRFRCWRTLQPNKILSAAALIPMKVKQDAINKCSSLSLSFQLKMFVECLQVGLDEITASRFYAFSCFPKSFCTFISHSKGLDIFVQIFVFCSPLSFWHDLIFFFFGCFIIYPLLFRSMLTSRNYMVFIKSDYLKRNQGRKGFC